MVYSLVTAATLGFDLSRLPVGGEVAAALVVGLDADAALVGRLAAHHPAAHHPGDDDPPPTGEDWPMGTPRGEPPTSLSAMVDRLRHTMLGDAAALTSLVHDDLIDPEVASSVVDSHAVLLAQGVIADAVVAAYSAQDLPPAVRDYLAGPYRRALPQGSPVVVDRLGPQTEPVLELLTAVAGLDEAGRRRWRATVDDGHSERARRGLPVLAWSTAMHEATWAAYLAGRTRVAAMAQLLAVLAFNDAGFGRRDAAEGVWNAVSGAVQGLVVQDLLEPGAERILLAPWLAVRAG